MSYLDKNVAIRKSTEELVAERDNALALYADGYRLIMQTNEILTRNGSYGLGYDVRNADTASAKKRLDQEFWRLAFKRTGLTRLMDKQACDEFHNSLEKSPPEFSMKNIQSTFLMMHQDAEMMFRRGIVNTFKSMSPNYWTNNNEPYVISEKSIIGYMFENNWRAPGHQLSYHNSAKINDIDRVVKVLSHRDWKEHSLETAINSSVKETTPGIYEDEDYHIKAFKNQNGHMTIKKPEIVAAINREMAAYFNHDQLQEAA
jgi:hypothetical protein